MRHVVTQPKGKEKDAESKPLSEPVLLILMKDIETLSNGRVRLSTGTLYGALRRLLKDRWIARFNQEDKSREKQAYKLTPMGRRQLELELDRMKQLTRTATARLRIRPV